MGIQIFFYQIIISNPPNLLFNNTDFTYWIFFCFFFLFYFEDELSFCLPFPDFLVFLNLSSSVRSVSNNKVRNSGFFQ